MIGHLLLAPARATALLTAFGCAVAADVAEVTAQTLSGVSHILTRLAK